MTRPAARPKTDHAEIKKFMFVLSGLALTLTLSLSGSNWMVAAGMALSVLVYAFLARKLDFSFADLGAKSWVVPICAAAALLCAAFFSLGFAGEVAIRFPALSPLFRWSVSGCVGALSLYALFILLCTFFRALSEPALHFMRSLRTYEIAYLIAWVVLLAVAIFWLFSQTSAFDAPTYTDGVTRAIVPWNAVYSVDTPVLLGDFLAPGYAEIRHPLFGVLVFPLGIVARVGAQALSFVPYAYAALLAVLCAALLGVSAVLLARMAHTAWLLAFYSASHCVLLYALCAERYQLSVLLLILSAYALVRGRRRTMQRGLLMMAAGATATSVFLAPLASDVRRTRQWIMDMLRWALAFLSVCVIAGRFPVLMSAVTDMRALLGEHAALPMTLFDRIAQYSSFMTACFVATPYGVTAAPWQRFTWLPVTQIDYVGVVIFALCLIGFLLHRKDRFAQICALWWGFSVLLLPIIGWGAGEFPFFSIYFSWAVLPLAWLGVRGFTRRLPAMQHIVATAALCVMLYINVPAFQALIAFARENYAR